MSANTAIQVTDLDFQEIKASLKSFLQSQSEFTDYDFTGSGLNVLLDVLAYNTHYNSYYLNMVANESFMDTAVTRNAVVSHAKKCGYTPRSRKSPTAYVNVRLTPSVSYTANTYTIPKYTTFSTLVDGIVYNYMTEEDETASKSGSYFTFNAVKIQEGEVVNYQYPVDTVQNPNLLFTIPETDIDTSTLKVVVYESSVSSNNDVFQLATDALTLTSNSNVYFLQEGQDSYYQIYFGDNVISKKLNNGNVVDMTYLKTNGDVSNGANTFSLTSSLTGVSASLVTPYLAASNGAERETIDQIKFSAPLTLLSQNRAVTKNDYIKMIQQKYPSFEAVNVWGGEENDPPVYGKVFISAKPKLGFEVTESEKEYVKEQILKPMSILTVTPEILDVDYNYLNVNVELYYDKKLTKYTESQLKTGIRNLVVDYCNKNLNQFNTYFKYSGLESAIDAFDSSIISCEVELYVEKRFRPNLELSNNYILDYGFELSPGVTVNNFYSTPDFMVIDELGVTRQCFFEEVPNSFTGVESITVTNPGYNYTSTPTVTIIGDGAGAKATATIVNGRLSKITVTNPGVGYTTAAVQITGGGGKLGAGSAVLEGRFGQLRMSYYKKDAVSGQSTKIIINSNNNNGVMGKIDYKLGKIYLYNFNPIDVNNDFGDIAIHMKPKINIIQSKFNKMLVLDSSDPASIVVKTKVV